MTTLADSTATLATLATLIRKATHTSSAGPADLDVVSLMEAWTAAFQQYEGSATIPAMACDARYVKAVAAHAKQAVDAHTRDARRVALATRNAVSADVQAARVRAQAVAHAWDMRRYAMVGLEQEQAAWLEDTMKRGVNTANAALDRASREVQLVARAVTKARDDARTAAEDAAREVGAAHMLDAFLLSLQRDLSTGVEFDSDGMSRQSTNPAIQLAVVESPALGRAAAALVAEVDGGSSWRVRATLRVANAATEDELVAIAAAHTPTAPTTRARTVAGAASASKPTWRCALLPLEPGGCDLLVSLLRHGVPPDLTDGEVQKRVHTRLCRTFPSGTRPCPTGSATGAAMSSRCVAWLQPRAPACDARVFFCVEARILLGGDDLNAPRELVARTRTDPDVRTAVEAIMDGEARLRALARKVVTGDSAEGSTTSFDLIECAVVHQNLESARGHSRVVRLHLAPANTARLLEHPLAAPARLSPATASLVDEIGGHASLKADAVPKLFLLSSPPGDYEYEFDSDDGENELDDIENDAEDEFAQTPQCRRWPAAHTRVLTLSSLAVRELIACYALRSSDAPTAEDAWPVAARDHASLAVCWNAGARARKHDGTGYPRVALILSLALNCGSVSYDDEMCAFSGCGAKAVTTATFTSGRGARLCALHRAVTGGALSRASAPASARKSAATQGMRGREPSVRLGPASASRTRPKSAVTEERQPLDADVWDDRRERLWIPRANAKGASTTRASSEGAFDTAAKLANVRALACESDLAAALLSRRGLETPWPIPGAIEDARVQLENLLACMGSNSQSSHSGGSLGGIPAGASRLCAFRDQVDRLSRTESRLSDAVEMERAVLGGLRDACSTASNGKLPRISPSEDDVELSRAVLAALARYGEHGTVRGVGENLADGGSDESSEASSYGDDM